MPSNVSTPTGNIWRLVDSDKHSQHFQEVFRFDFSLIDNEEIRYVLQQYVWRNYMTQNRVLTTLQGKMSAFKHFYAFACSQGISSFKELNNGDVTDFLAYLKVTASEQTKKPLSYLSQKGCLDVLKAIVRWGQIHTPDKMPAHEIFTGQEFRGVNKRLRIDFIPDSVVSQVNEALKHEENPYVKFGIIISESTGMRSGDMLLLETDCIKPHPVNGYLMTWYEHKKRKARAPIPITSECADAVNRILEVTKSIREQADISLQKYLFLNQPDKGRNSGKTCRISTSCMWKWLKDFTQVHNITDPDGSLYDITFHKFRRTLATDMFSKGTNIKVIQEALGHVSAATTRRYYADVKDTERAEMFSKIGIIGYIGQVNEKLIPNTAELHWFFSNVDGAARMCDGYCCKPLNGNELCERLVNRQKCYTCSRYITTLDDLEVHKAHLKELETMVEANPYGEHYASHFLPTINALKEIIRRLEMLKNEGK